MHNGTGGLLVESSGPSGIEDATATGGTKGRGATPPYRIDGPRRTATALPDASQGRERFAEERPIYSHWNAMAARAFSDHLRGSVPDPEELMQ
jgi:hypothetical protein